MTSKTLKLVASATAIVLALTAMMYATLSENTQYFKHVDEVMVQPDAWHGKQLKLHGYVDSIERKRDSLEYRFNVQNNGRIVQAKYTGIVPDTFKNGAEVVLDGRLTADGFHVDKDGVMAKCPSKYEEAKGAPHKTPPTAGS
jgi:cytochrome c-type biogenesis protein CcmE